MVSRKRYLNEVRGRLRLVLAAVGAVAVTVPTGGGVYAEGLSVPTPVGMVTVTTNQSASGPSATVGYQGSGTIHGSTGATLS